MQSVQDLRREAALDALEAAFPALFETYCRSEGAEMHDEPDCWWLRSNVDFAPFGGVYQTRFTEENADRRTAELLEKVRARPESACWFVSPRSTPADLGVRLERAGLQQIVEITGLALELKNLAPEPELPKGVEIVAAESEEQVREYARLYPLLFGEEDTSFFASIEASEVDSWRSGKDHLHRWLALKDGRPVCAGATSRGSAFARLDTLCTLPEERNQGIGAALATRGLLREQADGATSAMIWAGPGADKLYARMGFERICTSPIFLIQ